MTDEDDQNPDARAAERVMQQIEDGLARIARERAKVRPEDWATLYRQMQAVLLQIASHPFVTGDMEAELLIERILRSENLDEVDARTDHLAEYAMRKLDYIAELRAAQAGRPAEQRRHVAPRNTSSEVTRAEAAAGPSGEDFTANPEDSAGGKTRRSLLRL